MVRTTRAWIAVTSAKLYRGVPVTRQRPIVLGIVGDSAAGKTTITQGLVNILGVNCVTHVCTDDYHKYDRKERAERGITALHPECNYMDVIELHLERLHYGQPILKPVYYHPKHAAVLRCQSLSRPAGRDAEAVENQARYDQARLHHRAGAEGTRGSGTRLARLYPPPEEVCRHRRDVPWAGRRLAGRGGWQP